MKNKTKSYKAPIQTGKERGEAFQCPTIFKPTVYDECKKCYRSIKSLVTLKYTSGVTIGPLVLCEKCGDELAVEILFERFRRELS